jgi:hypothetical protein
MFLTLRQSFGTTTARFISFGIVFATPLCYYLWLEPNMSHSVAFFLISLWTYLLLQIDTSRNRALGSWVRLGVVLGLVALVRPYSAILGLTAIPIALRICSDGKGLTELATWSRAALRLVICCVTSILMLAPQIAVWRYLYGQTLVVPSGSGYEQMSLKNPELLRFTASIYTFFPLLIFATVGLLLYHRRPRKGPSGRRTAVEAADVGSQRTMPFAAAMAPFMLFVLFVFMYFVSGSRDWMLGTAFGQRRMVDFSAFYALGLGLFLQRFHWPSLATWLVWLATANAVLIVLFLLHHFPQYGMPY